MEEVTVVFFEKNFLCDFDCAVRGRFFVIGILCSLYPPPFVGLSGCIFFCQKLFHFCDCLFFVTHSVFKKLDKQKSNVQILYNSISP